MAIELTSDVIATLHQLVEEQTPMGVYGFSPVKALHSLPYYREGDFGAVFHGENQPKIFEFEFVLALLLLAAEEELDGYPMHAIEVATEW